MSYYNFAQLSDYNRVLLESRVEKENCIFISHKKEDENAAIEVGNFLLSEVGVNIYLDVNDCVLQEAVSKENDKKIVDSIKRGLGVSTHLLCLISDKTKLSWWVPFEIGVADIENKYIASLKLRNVDEIPSFLKIHETLYDIQDLIKYSSRVTPLSYYFESSNYSKLVNSDTRKLNQYIDERRK